MTTWGFREGTTQQVCLAWSLDDREDASDALCHHDLAHQLCATMWDQVRTLQIQQRGKAGCLPKNLEGTCIKTRPNT